MKSVSFKSLFTYKKKRRTSDERVLPLVEMRWVPDSAKHAKTKESVSYILITFDRQ
jgi:hypothetical protein